MCKENCKLSFEKCFSGENAADFVEIHEYEAATEKGEKHIGPSFVDETRKDLSKGDSVCYKKRNVTLSENCLCLKADCVNGAYSGAHATLQNKSFGNGYLEAKAKTTYSL